MDLRYENLTPTSFTLLWQPPPPDDQNGNIINYMVNFTELHAHNFTLILTNTTSLEAEMLVPFTTYACSVAAATAIGFGPYSQHLVIQTAEDGNCIVLSLCTHLTRFSW